MRHARSRGSALHMLGDRPRDEVDIWIRLHHGEYVERPRDEIAARAVAPNRLEEANRVQCAADAHVPAVAVAGLPGSRDTTPDVESQQETTDVVGEPPARR